MNKEIFEPIYVALFLIAFSLLVIVVLLFGYMYCTKTDNDNLKVKLEKLKEKNQLLVSKVEYYERLFLLRKIDKD